jgi:hypothetical protein
MAATGETTRTLLQHSRDATPPPEPTIDWAACERGERPHPDFDCNDYQRWKREQQVR